MDKNNLQHHLDLHRDDIDPEIFGAALAVKHISALIAKGGSECGRPDSDCSLHPLHLQTFLVRAVETERQIKGFEQEWHSLQKLIPHIQMAWEKGQTYFQMDLARVKSSQEETEYLSAVDFATDCYAYIIAKNTYPDNSTLQAWLINGYMLAWRQYFTLEQEDNE